MHTIFQNYTVLQRETPAFFAGANTGRGFIGEYDRIAAEEENRRVWIIKGGSGTGKSTMMGKIAAEAEETGHRCVRYLCSSDPTSLDAVVLDGQYVILDGTAPHVREMEYPGAVSEILYVGKYWKREKLEEARDEIHRLTQEKRDAYRTGYAALAAVEKLEGETYRASMGILDTEKLRHCLDRILKKVPKGERIGGAETCRTWAVSMTGLVRTTGLEQMAQVHWRIEDTCQTMPCFFGILAEVCREQKIPVWLSLHPVNDRIVEAYIPSLSLHLSGAAGGCASDKTICMSRFLQKELPSGKKGEIRLAAKCMAALLEQAVEHFRKAGECHGALEGIYRDAMDFARMNREMAGTRKQILKALGED